MIVVDDGDKQPPPNAHVADTLDAMITNNSPIINSDAGPMDCVYENSCSKNLESQSEKSQVSEVIDIFNYALYFILQPPQSFLYRV